MDCIVHGVTKSWTWLSDFYFHFYFPVLSDRSTMTHPSWVALHSMAHSFIELDKLWSMWSDWLVFCDCGFHSVCLLMEKDKKLMEASWWERLTEGETGFFSDGRAMLSKALIQFSVDGWVSVLSLLFDLRPNYGGGNEDNGNHNVKSLFASQVFIVALFTIDKTCNQSACWSDECIEKYEIYIYVHI